MLVEAYFEFAILHRRAWTARFYDHRLPDDVGARILSRAHPFVDFEIVRDEIDADMWMH